MDVIYNERFRLMSTALSNPGVATIAAGILPPFIGYIYGSARPDTGGWWLMIAVAWFLVGGLTFVGNGSWLESSGHDNHSGLLAVAPLVLLAAAGLAVWLAVRQDRYHLHPGA